MGDISEYRGLIIIFTFLGIFAILISAPILDARFAMSATNMTLTDTPSDKWLASTSNIGGFNTTWLGSDGYCFNLSESYEFTTDVYVVLNVGTGPDPYKFGGHDLDLYYTEPNQTTYSKHFINMRHNFGFLGADDMVVYDRLGTEISYLIVSPFIAEVLLVERIDLYSLPFKFQCPHFYMSADFYYNKTIWSDAIEAFNHNELYMLLGINFDQYGASYDAWSLISKLMMFQPVDIPSPLNLFIAFGLWAAISYMIFIFVLRVIGSVFGGGGA